MERQKKIPINSLELRSVEISSYLVHTVIGKEPIMITILYYSKICESSSREIV